jgi:RNase P/RNase MRP subunit POP5
MGTWWKRKENESGKRRSSVLRNLGKWALTKAAVTLAGSTFSRLERGIVNDRGRFLPSSSAFGRGTAGM